MDYRRRYGLEKIVVQATALAVLAAVYFWFGAAWRPPDPAGPITFFATGSFGQALRFAGMVWLLAMVCGLATASARAEGALVGVLVGAGGVSLKSPPVRALLWTDQAGIRAVLGAFILEALFLAAVVTVAVLMIAAIRGLLARVRPDWVWRSPLTDLTDEQCKRLRSELSNNKKNSLLLDLVRGEAAPSRALGGLLPLPARDRRARRELLVRSATCLVTAIAVALVLLLVLMKSAQRGQIICALGVSFCAGVLVAHQLFPTPLSVMAWLAPFPAAAALYALGAVSVTQSGRLAWTTVPLYARALPVDWLAAGAGGAVLGFWISSRMHELRILERLHQEETERDDEDG